jgi:hypothetical protein
MKNLTAKAIVLIVVLGSCTREMNPFIKSGKDPVFPQEVKYKYTKNKAKAALVKAPRTYLAEEVEKTPDPLLMYIFK